MIYFVDTEFMEMGAGSPIYLVSIGLVSILGREYYAESCEAPLELANPWVKANVLPLLGKVEGVSRHQIARDIVKFCNPTAYGKPEFWGYYADYDWVVLCQLFGSMSSLPTGWPMYCRDIKQWCDTLGNPALPSQGTGSHNALEDARWNRRAWEWLKGYEKKSNEQEIGK